MQSPEPVSEPSTPAAAAATPPAPAQAEDTPPAEPVEHESGPAPEHFVPRKPKPVMGVGFGNILKDIKPRRSAADES